MHRGAVRLSCLAWPARSGSAAFQEIIQQRGRSPLGWIHPARLQESGRIVSRSYRPLVNALLTAESQPMLTYRRLGMRSRRRQRAFEVLAQIVDVLDPDGKAQE